MYKTTHFNVFSYFHTEQKIFDWVWHLVMDFNFSGICFRWGKKAVDVVRQELNPVSTTSRLGMDSIVFQNVEQTSTLKTWNLVQEL